MAKKEYIERDRIVEFIENGLNNPDKAEAFGHDAIEILAEIHLAPAADVVEVVRCEKCKHGQRGRNGYLCEYDRDKQYVNGKHYCSFGEKIVE